MDDHGHSLLHPDGHYQTGSPRLFERLALVVAGWRSPFVFDRTRDAIEVRFPTDLDAAADLVVLLTSDAIEFRLPTIDWTMGSHGPAVSSILWRRLDWREDDELRYMLVEALDGGEVVAWMQEHLCALQAAFEESLETCVYCNKSFLPARMAGEACHGCAEKHEGVVF